MSFYRYSTLAGRLIRSTQSAALRPQGLAPLIEENIGSTFMFSSSAVKTAEVKVEEIRPTDAVGVLAGGNFKGSKFIPVGEEAGVPGTRGMVPNTPKYKHLMKLQEEWSNSEELTYLLRGGVDRIIYYIVYGSALACIPLSGWILYQLMYPKPNQD